MTKEKGTQCFAIENNNPQIWRRKKFLLQLETRSRSKKSFLTYISVDKRVGEWSPIEPNFMLISRQWSTIFSRKDCQNVELCHAKPQRNKLLKFIDFHVNIEMLCKTWKRRWEESSFKGLRRGGFWIINSTR